MRRLLMFLVLAVVVGGAVGTLMSRDPGYVLITYEDMSFETSVWFALFALIVGYFLLRLFIGIWTWVRRGRTGIADWRENRRSRTAQARTVRGLLLAGEGDWAGARKSLLADAQLSESPLINYVGAAHAANELGESAERDGLLKKAADSTPGASLALALTQAEMQLSAQQTAAALETLQRARSESPNHTGVLRMLARCHEQSGDWGELIALTPELGKRGALSPDALRASSRRWCLAYFDRPPTAASADAATQLIAQWKNVDKDLRADPELISAFARALVSAGAADEAEATLSKALRQDWNDGLVALYGRVRVERSDRQLATAEGWLKERPNDATLLLALGRIAAANRDWPKSREYFEASLKQRQTAEVYGELGRLCLAMGERPRAGELLAQGLAMSGQLPELPLPAAAPPDAIAAARS